MLVRQLFQTAIRLVYPPTCMTCDAPVAEMGGLCGACWRETPFVSAPVCAACGAPMPSDHAEEGEHCDDCLRAPRPWVAGRTAMVYGGNGRRIVLGLKHGDRLDYVDAVADWMAEAGRDLILPGMIVTAIPLHWRRRIKRRYNQSAMLAHGVARCHLLPCVPDLLIRPQSTPVLDGKSPAQRFADMAQAIRINPNRAGLAVGRPVLVVDDVMTSGATLSAACQALMRAGAADVRVLTLARAVKDA
ncbi:ComF family protein [Pseudooceanicola sp. MF1-13]|uniref:ComF family protein n=1 Tax=Pseudooceanicola sp. MF1-13 TaxID=3379095 RepID=UPI003891D571